MLLVLETPDGQKITGKTLVEDGVWEELTPGARLKLCQDFLQRCSKDLTGERFGSYMKRRFLNP